MTIDELQKLVPELEWRDGIKETINPNVAGYDGKVLKGFGYLDGNYSVEKTGKLCFYLYEPDRTMNFEWITIEEFRRRLRLRAFE